MPLLRNIFFLAMLLLPDVTHAAQANRVSSFLQVSEDVPPPWRMIQLDKRISPTLYRVSRWDGVLGIEAFADHSMSLMARPVSVDLKQTPILCWHWRVDAPLQHADMRKKSGDDYAARVYVSFALPAESLGWVTRSKLKLARLIWGEAVPDAAINYVWDNQYPVGTRQPNAYTDRAYVIVSKSGDAHAGQWVAERHDVLKDVIEAFGVSEVNLIQLAVASDTDNTGEKAHAGFADFHFMGRNQRCDF